MEDEPYLERHENGIDVYLYWDKPYSFAVYVVTEDTQTELVTKSGKDALDFYKHPMVYA